MSSPLELINLALNNKKTHILLVLVSLFLLCFITYWDTLTHEFMIDDNFFVDPTTVVSAYQHYDGTIVKKNISEVGASGRGILKELIKKGVLEDVSLTKVRLEPGLAKKEPTVRSIAKDDFDKIWIILQKAYYFQTMSPAFVYFPDPVTCFTKSFGRHYNPFNLLLNEGLFRLFDHPFYLYLCNILFLYINCILLFFFVYLISKDLVLALLTSIFFCIHPMTGDMLEHITFNIMLVQTIFIESALIFLYLYAKQNKHVLYYFLSILMTIFALFCHEISLLFPLYAAAMLFCLTDLDLKRIIKLIVPYVLLSLSLIVLWLLMVHSSQYSQGLKSLLDLNIYRSIANFSHLCSWYLGNLIIPRDIIFMCNMPPLKNFIWLWSISFFLFLVAAGFVVSFIFKRSLESFALILFLIGFIFAFPASNAEVGMGGIFEPNWIYFSSIGFYLFVAVFILRWGRKLNKLFFVSIFSIVLICYFISTLNHNILSRTEKSYCEYWLRKFPGNFIAEDRLKTYYIAHKEAQIPSDLIPNFLTLVDVYIKSDNPDTLNLIDRLSSCKLSLAQSKELFYKSGAYYCKNGFADQCGEFVQRNTNPKDPSTFLELSYVFYSLGADKMAIDLLRQSMVLYPQYTEPYLLMGVILGNENRFDESIEFWKKGLAIDPSDKRFVLNINRAVVLNTKERSHK